MRPMLHGEKEADHSHKAKSHGSAPRLPPGVFRAVLFHFAHIMPIGMPMGPKMMLSADVF